MPHDGVVIIDPREPAPRHEQIRLVPLGPAHASALLAGQDEDLVREVFGRRWDEESLDAFCARASRWRPDGPIRELVALNGDGAMVGGGGVHLLGAGLERGQADLTYWVLAPARGRGIGQAIAARLLALARRDVRVTDAVLRIAPGNVASTAVARALGAAPTGHLERHPADTSRHVERWSIPVG